MGRHAEHDATLLRQLHEPEQRLADIAAERDSLAMAAAAGDADALDRVDALADEHARVTRRTEMIATARRQLEPLLAAERREEAQVREDASRTAAQTLADAAVAAAAEFDEALLAAANAWNDYTLKAAAAMATGWFSEVADNNLMHPHTRSQAEQAGGFHRPGELQGNGTKLAALAAGFLKTLRARR